MLLLALMVVRAGSALREPCDLKSSRLLLLR